ncbi:DUF1003 domain-containing protein [Arthrobacter bambusae]|uniref:Membrane protein n=1 Tax=Arthrobacter bambusae TaxID=1338426 RepID=A0AAW8DAN7_9MICC|nr:DUF1003 domain-containing protein [Arthrobacter bambusae]MDP9904790.1 putative membrane protein [Arthrobacter bambusae]MDQ0129606.1 putative membrane protein [Arthrobacter bambusae]MDQ0180781.1 putative membrane protein [Arthrobacter bambusae]
MPQPTGTRSTSTTGTLPHSRSYLRPTRLLSQSERSKLHPSVLAEAERRAASIQLRVADAITAFAGSMNFVYLHVLLFAVWMLVFEQSPWPTLTLIVSLEAIFLSTFVMIGQNRQAAFQQVKADRDYHAQERLLEENTDLTRAIHELTAQIHQRILAEATASATEKSTSTAKQDAPAYP